MSYNIGAIKLKLTGPQRFACGTLLAANLVAGSCECVRIQADSGPLLLLRILSTEPAFSPRG